MSTRDQMQPSTLTSTEIAQIADVTPSAVSNWKRRHADFPAEIDDGLYDTEEIVEWLGRQGRSVDFGSLDSAEAAFWSWADRIRAILPVDQMPEVLLQLFALRAAESGSIERLQPLRGFWQEMRAEIREDMGAVHQRLQSVLGEVDPELFDALRVSPLLHQLDTEDWRDLVDLVDQRDPSTTDWGYLANSIVVGFLKEYGAKGGVFSTGSDLVDVMSVFLSPIQGKVYDPAFGAGVFLASAWRRGAGSIERLYGQEISAQSWRIGFLHLLLWSANFDLRTGDTLADDQFRDLRANRIALDPPLGLKPRVDPSPSDARWQWGIPSRTNADLLWVEHVAFHLADDGIGVVLVSPGSLAGQSERRVRASLLEAGLIEIVVQMPPGTLAATSIAPCLIVLRKQPQFGGEVLFIDARHLGSPERGRLRTFAEEDFTLLAGVVGDWRTGQFTAESQFTGSASLTAILRFDADLSPARYISYDETITEIDGEQLTDRYARLLEEAQSAVREVLGAGRGFLDAPPRLNATPAAGNYQKRSLGELLELEPASGVKLVKEGEGNPVPYVTTEAVSQGPPTLRDRPEITTRGNVKDRLVERGDLLLESRGVKGLNSIPCAKVDFDGQSTYSHSLIRLRVNNELVDPDYLRLYLSSRRGGAVLAAAATGNVISNLRRDALAEVEIHMPDIGTQRRIVQQTALLELVMSQIREASLGLQTLHDTVREGVAAGQLLPITEGNE